MKIKLLCLGSIKNERLTAIIDDYTRRIGHYYPFEIVCLPDVRTTKAMTEQRQKELEGERILAQILPADTLVLLDERGRQFTSREFAGWLERKAVSVQRNLFLVVGGPYGFSTQVYDRAESLLALSKMTFPHELVRLFVTEQIYRACTILNGEPYHHD